MQTYAEKALQYAANNVTPLAITLVRGEGIYVYDEQNRRYVDMMSAVAVNNFGHCHPRLINALTSQAKKLTMTSRLLHNDVLGDFLQLICELTGFPKAFPLNSGVEAIETAVKAARKWSYLHKQVPENKAEIIVCSDNFHGRSVATVSMSSYPSYRQHFGPFAPGFKIIPYNDIQALEQAINPHTAAFLVEPIQGEAGVQIPDAGYLKRCAEICQQENILLLCDEIQTGIGRTGKLLASQYEQVKPDGVLLGKALGGGMLPVSVFLAKDELMSVFEPGDHGCTFGGNPLAAAVAKEALLTLQEEKLAENAAQQGEYFLQQLMALDSPLITGVRGKGLLVAVDINLKLTESKNVCQKLSEAGLLTINTRCKCLRLLPPLLITKDQIDESIDIFRKTLS